MHYLYPESQRGLYNIAALSLMDWFNSQPVRDFRQKMLQSARISECRRCYVDEDHGGNSRRYKSNQKSVIFTKTAFADSFEQSPGHAHFLHSANNQGHTLTYPIDLHIDLGNYCNLACKMCGPQASTTIAVQQVKWGDQSSQQYLGNDWTRDARVWHSFKSQLAAIPGLNNIHFMGGETLLTDRMEDLVDHMIAQERFDLCFSFVTNGTVWRPDLAKKLSKFRRVGFEISIESLTQHNAYTRQGTDTAVVLQNIQRYREMCNGDNITVTLRTAPSALTIGSYHTLLKWALEHRLVVKSNPVVRPRCLVVETLPQHVKQQYLQPYLDLLAQLNSEDTSADYNASDPNNHARVIKEQVLSCVSLLQTSTPPDADAAQEAMTRHCEKWDRVYKLDARALYPELHQVWDRYDYKP
jgi:pyruvate-formate lyase-activating enzyme